MQINLIVTAYSPGMRRAGEERGIAEERKETSGGIECVHYVDCTDGVPVLVVCLKYVQFMTCQLYLNKAVYQKKVIVNLSVAGVSIQAILLKLPQPEHNGPFLANSGFESVLTFLTSHWDLA